MWKLMQEQDNLVIEARRRAVAMLRTTQQMFENVIKAMRDGPGAGHRGRVRDIDKEINREQREVRRMVFEHLVLSSGRDLLEGLRLVTVVIDIERIGDYSKNIEELFEMFPQGFDLGEDREQVAAIEARALEGFGACIQAFESGDEAAAQRTIAAYDEVARYCELHLRKVMLGNQDDACIDRNVMGAVLLMRYLKRTCGHLKNIASAMINPFDRIGFRVGID
ncbi:MAG: PhoU domain-containing protein [Pseudomonadota bacterium]